MAKLNFYICAIAALSLAACSDDDPTTNPEPTPTELSEEWFAGGKLGTAFNSTSSAYEQSTPAVDADPAMAAAFLRGESFFEDVFITGTDEGAQRQGLGPLYLRNSCISCHPGYGHGKRQTRYRANDFGNGYLLVITDETDTYLSSLTGMPQTKAVPPFKAPIDEEKIKIDWLTHTDEWGNQFPDGETYSLIYPEVTIPEEAYYVPLEVTKNGETTLVPYNNVKVRLESTIGIYGSGLLDAIPDQALKEQYIKEEQAGIPINPTIFANGEWTKTYGTTGHPLRFTYALSRGPVQDGPGANAIWNITNVTRSDRRYNYMTTTYANVASEDPEVTKEFYNYFPQYNKTGDVKKDIYNFLVAPDKDLPIEMKDNEYTDLMVWHRGLAVPAARDLDDADVQKGKKLFTEIGCAHCHRPSWTTADDTFTDPNGFFSDGDSRLPRYPNQKIWPYTDLVQHRLTMANDIRTGWCRTTPLWGRGLSEKCTGASDRLHDCRARTVIEAIMWHGSATSDARSSIEQFRNLNKSDRDAIVKFIEAI
ncbi:di-heme oxidoredictase family protein [uncultured Bacteroides sp.]|uniref:di-heme oxidoredictase family protein n=1 Tax=uncultured Bacteroides sp. TaxID=162156 RepID=UPI0025D30C67|nr:di-heme oxidoredictase family protein [uncultured Bacteroides sp.]